MRGSSPPEDTDLLLVHADALEPVLDVSLPSAWADAGREEVGAAYEDPEHLWDESRGANELPAQRWGVIAPEGPEGDALLGRIAPLIEHRRAQQEGHEVRIYRVPPDQDGADAAQWRKQCFDTVEVRRRDLPRYLLVLGDLDQVSVDLQVVMGSDGYVGRLAFDDPQHYEAYVDKLLRWERSPAAIARARAVFHTVQDRTSATTAGHRNLMVPGLSMARSHVDTGDFLASDVIEVDHGYTPKPGPLVQEAIKEEPGVLLTISHGAGAPRQGWRSVTEQRMQQGGMSFGPSGGLLIGEAMAGRRFLPGGVWFMVACFGAGTPSRSKYEPWLRHLAKAGAFQGSTEAVGASLATDGRSFTAAVPKAVLASPEGPLAFIGHVDLAWTYSFRELDGQKPVNRPDRFVDVLAGLLRHDRVGVAFRQLLRHYGQTNTELTSVIERGDADPERRGHLWMLRNDLAGYILLGDPAVRLPITPAQAADRGGALDPYAALGLSPSAVVQQSASPAQQASGEAAAVRPPAGPTVGLDELERAIGLYLAGEMGTLRILRECGLNLGRSDFEDLVERYTSAGRGALGYPTD